MNVIWFIHIYCLKFAVFCMFGGIMILELKHKIMFIKPIADLVILK
jgi:hypothetical protein